MPKEDPLSILVDGRNLVQEVPEPSQEEQELLVQVQVMYVLPDLVNHMTFLIQVTAARFIFNLDLPLEYAPAEVEGSRSIALWAPYLDSSDLHVSNCSALSGMISSAIRSLNSEITNRY